MEITLQIVCDNKHSENHLQDVSQCARILPIELDDAYPDDDGKRFCKFICGCTYRTVNHIGYYFHKRIVSCGDHQTLLETVSGEQLV